MNLYKAAINECCHPDCTSGLDLETHHIVPLAKGGIDDYSNYIVSCFDCHRRRKMHSKYHDKLLEVIVYKYYREALLVGINSDDERKWSDFVFALYRASERNRKEIQNKIRPDGLCSVEGCTKTAKAKGMCCAHYCQLKVPGRKHNKIRGNRKNV